jgi:hypothetical protein
MNSFAERVYLDAAAEPQATTPLTLPSLCLNPTLHIALCSINFFHHYRPKRRHTANNMAAKQPCKSSRSVKQAR